MAHKPTVLKPCKNILIVLIAIELCCARVDKQHLLMQIKCNCICLQKKKRSWDAVPCYHKDVPCIAAMSFYSALASYPTHRGYEANSAPIEVFSCQPIIVQQVCT